MAETWERIIRESAGNLCRQFTAHRHRVDDELVPLAWARLTDEDKAARSQLDSDQLAQADADAQKKYNEAWSPSCDMAEGIAPPSMAFAMHGELSSMSELLDQLGDICQRFQLLTEESITAEWQERQAIVIEEQKAAAPEPQFPAALLMQVPNILEPAGRADRSGPEMFLSAIGEGLVRSGVLSGKRDECLAELTAAEKYFEDREGVVQHLCLLMAGLAFDAENAS